MLSPANVPNPLESVEQKARTNSVLAALELTLQKFSLVMLLGLIICAVLLVLTWLGIIFRTPDYKLGNTIVEIQTPLPFSQNRGNIEVKLNVLTAIEAKNLQAYILDNGNQSAQLDVTQTGKDVVTLSGIWNTGKVSQTGFMDVALFTKTVDQAHPLLLYQVRVPLTIIQDQ